MPANSAGDILLYSYFKKYMLQNIGKSEAETMLLCSDYDKRACQACGISEMHCLPMPQIAAMSMALHYYGAERINMTNVHVWCLFDYGNIQNPDITPMRPDFIGRREQVTNALLEIGCEPGRTIVLAPYEQSVTANHLKKPVPEFWEELAERLKALGFCVCTNCKGDEKEPPIKGTNSIFPALGECEELVNTAGGSVMMRSGFADFTAMSDGFTAVLYPTENFYYKFKIWIAEKYSNHYEFIYQDDMSDSSYRKEMTDRIVEKWCNEKID